MRAWAWKLLWDGHRVDVDDVRSRDNGRRVGQVHTHILLAHPARRWRIFLTKKIQSLRIWMGRLFAGA